MNRHVTGRLIIQHTLACIRLHASAAVVGDGEDEEDFTRDAFEDMEVMPGDVIDDGRDDEEEVVYVLLTISEFEVVKRDDGEGKQDKRTGVATATEIIRDNGVPLWSFMAARGVCERKGLEKNQILAKDGKITLFYIKTKK
jgi:hypothetical protein